jgi:hypothetical protein
MSKNRQYRSRTPLTADDGAPILLPACTEDRTYGDHLRHLASHAGALPPTLDEFSKRTLQRWQKANKGPPRVKIGGRIFYDEGKLKAWIQDQ